VGLAFVFLVLQVPSLAPWGMAMGMFLGALLLSRLAVKAN
jgi:hypothetical protein